MTYFGRLLSTTACALLLSAIGAQAQQSDAICDSIKGLNPAIVDDMIEAQCLAMADDMQGVDDGTVVAGADPSVEGPTDTSSGNVSVSSDGLVVIDFGVGGGGQSGEVVTTAVSVADTVDVAADVSTSDGIGVTSDLNSTALADVRIGGNADTDRSSLIDIDALGRGTDSGNDVIDVNLGSSRDTGSDSISVDVASTSASDGGDSSSSGDGGSSSGGSTSSNNGGSTSSGVSVSASRSDGISASVGGLSVSIGN